MKHWILGEGDQLHPVTGRILAVDGAAYAKAGPPSLPAAAGAKAQFFCARNETVAFHWIFEKGALPLSGLDFRVSSFAGEKRLPVQPAVKIFREWYVNINGAWYPDALIPVFPRGKFSLNEPSNRIPGQRYQGFYVEVFVPAPVAPGGCGALLSLCGKGGTLAEVGLSLNVLSVTLPSRPSFTFELNNYGGLPTSHKIPFQTPKDGVRARETAEYERQLHHHHRLAHENYTCLNILPYTQAGFFSPKLAPALGPDHRIQNFISWDKKFGPFLSGSAFREGYGAGEPVSHFYLPFSFMWPAPYATFPSDHFTGALTDAARRFERHVREKGWDKTEYHIMLNHKQRRSPFPFNADEPTRIRDYGMLKYYGEAIRAGRAGKKSPLVYRMDMGHYECTHIMDECDWLPGERRCSHTDQLDAVTDLWVVSTSHANRASFERRKRRGEKVWLYQGASWINRPLNEMRQLLLHTYGLGATGYCAWNSNGWDGANPWQEAGKHFGFNFLLYPGEEAGFREPLPSLRLKMARRAVIDIEYLALQKKARAGVQPGMAKVLKTILKGYNADRTSLMDQESAAEEVGGFGPSHRKAGWDQFRRSLIQGVAEVQ